MTQYSDQDFDQKYVEIANRNRVAYRKRREVSDLSVSQDVSGVSTPKSSRAPYFKQKYPQSSQPNVNHLQTIESLSIENQALVSQNNSLQEYIQQLTTYINESSQKYSDNIQKYGISYKQLYLKFTNLQQSSEQESLGLRNQLQSLTEVNFNKSKQVDGWVEKNKRLHEEIEEERQQRRVTNQEIKALWNDDQENKKKWNVILEENELEMKRFKEMNEELSRELREKSQKIKELESIGNQLQGELRKRQELPERIIDREKQVLSANIDLRNQKAKKEDLLKELDFLKLQLSKSEKDREQLRMKNVTLSGDFENNFRIKNKEYEEEWRQKEFKFEVHITQLKEEVERIRRELQEEIKLSNELKDSLDLKSREIGTLSKRVKNEIAEKESSFAQFRVLKQNYQEVITSLESTIQELQNKLWNVSDKNKELEFQVDKFREVTCQLQYINNQNEKREGTDYLKQQVEVWGLGDPVRLLRGQEESKEVERELDERRRSWKEKEKREKEGKKGQEQDPWSNLMDKISSM